MCRPHACALLLVISMLGSMTVAAAADPATPTNRIGGRVTDATTGSALPGARVVVVIWPDPGALPYGVMAESRIAWLETSAGADGAFEVTVPAGFASGARMALLAQARGHAEWRGGIGTGEPKTMTLPPSGTPLAIVMKPGRTLDGVVKDATGGPVAGARLTMTLSGQGWCSWPQGMRAGNHSWPGDVTTDKDGRWQILGFPFEAASARPGSRWVLTIESDSTAPVVVQNLERLPDVDGVVRIETTARPARHLSGVVRGEDGAPVANATVSAVGAARPDEPMCVQIQSKATSSEDGRFELAGLDERPFEVRASAPGFAPSAELEVHPADSKTPVEIPMKRGSILRGRVITAAGAPISGVAIYASVRSARYHDDTITSDDGSFEFPSLPSDGKVLVRSATLFDREIALPAQGIVEIRVPDPRRVIVALTRDEDGKPVAPEGWLYFRGASISSGRNLKSPDGRVDLGPLAPGEYTLDLVAPDRMLATLKVTVEPGGSEPEIVPWKVPAGFTLSGRVTDKAGRPVERATVKAQGMGGVYDERSATTDHDGRYELKGLNASSEVVGSFYAIWVSAEGKATYLNVEPFARVSVLPRTLDVQLEDGATVRGRVTHADGSPAVRQMVTVHLKRRFFSANANVASALTGEDGRYLIEHAPPERVVVATGAASKALDLDSGHETTLDLKIP